jgi:hypothetical protein
MNQIEDMIKDRGDKLGRVIVMLLREYFEEQNCSNPIGLSMQKQEKNSLDSMDLDKICEEIDNLGIHDLKEFEAKWLTIQRRINKKKESIELDPLEKKRLAMVNKPISFRFKEEM